NILETEPPSAMAEKCKVTELIDFISKKWIIIILHAVHGGADTFSAIQKSATGINSRMLSERLTDMQEYGIVDRKVICEKPVRIRYSLTKKGLSLAEQMDNLNELARTW
ncbi:MAG: helix-turn-helix domain-containing protein, partial [Patescibacteria group bacterium]